MERHRFPRRLGRHGDAPDVCFPYFTIDHVRVEGVRLNAGFVLRDPRPLLIGDVAGSEDRVLSIASNADGWLVVWKNGFEGSIRARHVKRDGNVDGPIEGSVVGDGSAAGIAWDGNRYAIAWKTARRPQTIQLAYLTSIHPIIAGPAISVAPTERHQRQIALTSSAPLQMALVYGRFTTEEIYGGVPASSCAAPRPRRGGPRPADHGLRRTNESWTDGILIVLGRRTNSENSYLVMRAQPLARAFEMIRVS